MPSAAAVHALQHVMSMTQTARFDQHRGSSWHVKALSYTGSKSGNHALAFCAGSHTALALALTGPLAVTLAVAMTVTAAVRW
jgi:hypothetical protein